MNRAEAEAHAKLCKDVEQLLSDFAIILELFQCKECEGVGEVRKELDGDVEWVTCPKCTGLGFAK